MLVPRKERGRLNHPVTNYGHSQLGTALEIRLPEDTSTIPILLMAGIHGDEPEGTVLLSEALRTLPGKQLKSAVILSANPDGIQYGTRANSRGVDLNRNFPASNWSDDPVYYRLHMDEPQDIELRTGSSAGSEPEIQALVSIIKKIRPRAIIAFHSALACIDDPNKSRLGAWISKQTGLPHVDDVGYPTPGSFGSWAADHKIPLVTFELPPEPLTAMKTTYVPILIDLLTDTWDRSRPTDQCG